MYAFIKSVLRQDANVLALWAVGSLVAAIGLEYFYRGHTLATVFSKWIFFYFFAALGLLTIGAVQRYEVQRTEELAGKSVATKKLSLTSKVQISAMLVLLLLFLYF